MPGEKKKKKKAAPNTAVARAQTSVGGGRPEDITEQQYHMAWRLMAADCTVTQIMAGSGLNKAQLTWLMQEGDESRGMPSFAKMILEQVAAMRGRAQEAANKVGIEALEALGRQMKITRMTQQIMLLLLQEVGTELAMNDRAAPQDKKPLHRVVPTRQVVDTIKTLRPLADYTNVALAYRAVFDSPFSKNDPISSLPRETRVDFSTESLIPASMALLSEGKSGAVTRDILQELLPEMRGWTQEEVELFAETGERPKKDYQGG